MARTWERDGVWGDLEFVDAQVLNLHYDYGAAHTGQHEGTCIPWVHKQTGQHFALCEGLHM